MNCAEQTSAGVELGIRVAVACSSQDVLRVRRQAAIARAVLEEVDRTLPAAGWTMEEQIAEELSRLGRLLLDIAEPLAGARRQP